MSSPQRRVAASLMERLLSEPHRFEFFQAVRLLERWFARSGTRGVEAAGDDRIRFRSSLSFAFPSGEIEALRVTTASGESIESDLERQTAIRDGAKVRLAVTPTVFGLLGGNGALPPHFSERIAAHELYRRDRGVRAFLDIFNNRATAQFYSAWKKYRLPLQYETDQRERFLPLLLALTGISGRTMRYRLRAARGGVFDESIAYYAGAISQRPASAHLVARVLADYFSVPVRMEQFVGRWYPIPHTQRTSLGLANGTLDRDAFVGETIWQRQLRIVLHVGPLDRHSFEKFLPEGSAAMALGEFITLMLGPTFEYEVRLTLRKEDVLNVELGSQSRHGRLGWDAWLQTRPATADRQDAVFEIQAA